jgi:hypothetical protein
MTIHTCRFVKASDLFKGLKALWDEFANSDPDFSWGGKAEKVTLIIDFSGPRIGAVGCSEEKK